MPYWIASIIFIVFLILLIAFAYYYEEVLQIIISAGIGCLCVCGGIMSGAYLIFFIIGAVCFIYAGIIYFDKRPLKKRDHKKNNKEKDNE